MLEEELDQLRNQSALAEERLEALLAPRDPMADKSVIMEIRAGTGGEEAALFAADLYRMYSRYADSRVECRDHEFEQHRARRNQGNNLSISGDSVYERLRLESGVQVGCSVCRSLKVRAESTPAPVTVAVLPEMEVGQR